MNKAELIEALADKAGLQKQKAKSKKSIRCLHRDRNRKNVAKRGNHSYRFWYFNT